MEVKEVRCYNKEKNQFKTFNAHILTECWMQRNGFRPVPEVKEEPIVITMPAGCSNEQLDYTAASCESTKPKRSHKKKINANRKG